MGQVTVGINNLLRWRDGIGWVETGGRREMMHKMEKMELTSTVGHEIEENEHEHEREKEEGEGEEEGEEEGEVEEEEGEEEEGEQEQEESSTRGAKYTRDSAN